MKFQRTNKGVTIELSEEECKELHEDLHGWGNKEEPNRATSLLYFELEEYFGENNE